MAGDPFDREKFRRPELLFKEFLRKGAQGVFRENTDATTFLYRALVLAVDVEGGLLENPSASGKVTHDINGKQFDVAARLGPKNPQNSIKARILTDGFDKFANDDNLRVFWPFFPENISLPIKPGEHVYVIFEDSQQQHGLWISKIPGHEGVNYAPGASFYTPTQQAPLANMFVDTRSAGTQDKKFDKDSDAAETKPGNRLSSLFGG